MPPPVLGTKIFVPSPRPDGVPRPHLMERLRRGLHQSLTLVAAPAGFGKTTLVARWAAEADRPVAWVSLDEGDSEPKRFLTHLVAALQTIAPGIGDRVLAVLDAAGLPSAEDLLTPLVNDLVRDGTPSILVLDDYHAVESRAVDAYVDFLVQHRPPHLHLILIGRQDPPLPLARLRAAGQLVELRASDLRFSPTEAAAFLGRSAGVELNRDHVAALEARTEGWPAGLQMAALSLQGREDVDAFIATFTGSHRFVLDYLADEVLARQDERVRSFLLRTSVLDRLTGALCDALTGERAGTGRATLEALERANLLIVPLDDERAWYRYHHLFADVLRATHAREAPDEVVELHRRASAWHERHGLAEDAIHHAFEARDPERAADLLEAVWRKMDRTYRSGEWLTWANRLPSDLIRGRPLLSTGMAWALLDAGEMEAAAPHLQHAADWLEQLDPGEAEDGAPGRVGYDPTERRLLPATVASGLAYRARAIGDHEASARHARRALDHLPRSAHFQRGLAGLLVGCARWAAGELDEARVAVTDAVTSMWSAGNVAFAISFTSYLGDVLLAKGDFDDAAALLRGAFEKLEGGVGGAQELAVLHLGSSEVRLERGELDEALEHIAVAERLGEHPFYPPWHRRSAQARARVRLACDDPGGALAELAGSERRLVRHAVPDTRPLAAMRARAHIALGDLSAAEAWERKSGLSPVDPPVFLREYELITLARLRIGQERRHGGGAHAAEAIRLCERLLDAARSGDRWGSAVEILVLLALAHEVVADGPAARSALARAVVAAEPRRQARPFLGEGAALGRLMRAIVGAEGVPEYAGHLLRLVSEGGRIQIARMEVRLGGASDDAGDVRTMLQGPSASAEGAAGSAPVAPSAGPQSGREPPFAGLQGGQPPPAPSPPTDPLVEPLTDRELEVLRLVAQGLSNRAIGERLFRALDTIKGHNRRIYAKLQVKNRTEAVARARELGLLDA